MPIISKYAPFDIKIFFFKFEISMRSAINIHFKVNAVGNWDMKRMFIVLVLYFFPLGPRAEQSIQVRTALFDETVRAGTIQLKLFKV